MRGRPRAISQLYRNREEFTIPNHWTDRPASEPLGDWLSRLYENCNWEKFDAMIEELKRTGAGFPGTTVETLYLLREMEKNVPK